SAAFSTSTNIDKGRRSMNEPLMRAILYLITLRYLSVMGLLFPSSACSAANTHFYGGTTMREKLLTTKEAASYLGVSVAFLERDRWAGARIQFVRVGKRAVRYRL